MESCINARYKDGRKPEALKAVFDTTAIRETF